MVRGPVSSYKGTSSGANISGEVEDRVLHARIGWYTGMVYEGRMRPRTLLSGEPGKRQHGRQYGRRCRRQHGLHVELHVDVRSKRGPSGSGRDDVDDKREPTLGKAYCTPPKGEWHVRAVHVGVGESVQVGSGASLRGRAEYFGY